MELNSPICYIFGAGECNLKQFSKTEQDFVIAADGGLATLEKFSVTPDLIVGDFDSLGYVPTGKNVICHPVMKDFTDTALAIDCGVEKGFKNFVVFGALGGRLDHTFANIATVADCSQKGIKVFLAGDGITVTAITDGDLNFSEKHKGIISVFAFGNKAKGVDIKGFKYSLQNADLSPNFPIGVSNEFVGKKSTVSVKNGTLVVMWHESIIIR